MHLYKLSMSRNERNRLFVLPHRTRNLPRIVHPLESGTLGLLFERLRVLQCRRQSTWFTLMVPIAYVSFDNNSKKRPMLEKKLSIIT